MQPLRLKLQRKNKKFSIKHSCTYLQNRDAAFTPNFHPIGKSSQGLKESVNNIHGRQIHMRQDHCLRYDE